MKIILLQDVPKLGKRDEIKEVHDGYARNFLFAKNLARPANPEFLKTLHAKQEKEANEGDTRIERYRALVEQLKLRPLTFKIKMGEKGKAFGSVSPSDIQQELKRRGVAVEKNWIEAEKHIKTSGLYQVKIKFPHDIVGEVNVTVAPE